MAYFDAFNNVQFLDLTGVDDEEKNWILASLHSGDAPVEGPWGKPKKARSHSGTQQQSKEFPLEPLEVESEYVVIPNHVRYPMSPQVYTQPYQPGLPMYQPPFVATQYATTMVSPVQVVNHMVPATMVPMNAPMVQVPSHFTQPIPVTFSPNNYGLVQAQHSPQTNPANLYNMNVVSHHVEPVQMENQPILQMSQNGPTIVEDNAPSDVVNGSQRNGEKNIDLQHVECPLGPQVGLEIQHLGSNATYGTGDPHDEPKSPLAVENNGNNNGIENMKEANIENVNESGNKSWASLFDKNKKHMNGINTPTTPLDRVNEVKLSRSKVQDMNANNKVDDFKEFKMFTPLAHIADPNYYRMAEILESYQADHKIISLQPRGLINKSNYCYINSILQAILACPPIYNLFHKLSENVNLSDNRKYTRIVDNMIKFIKEFRHLPPGQRVGRRSDAKHPKKDHLVVNCERAFEPSWIYKMLNGIKSDSFIVEGRQEDAEEFLGCLLNGLNDEMMELMKLVSDESKMETATEDVDKNGSEKEWQVIGPKNKGSVTRRTEIVRTPISSIFGGYIRSRVHRYGDQITDNIQPFFTLQLNIEKVNTVREALEALVCKNQLEGVTSSKTNEEVEAWQQVTIEELPVVLILHLKCFDFKPDGCAKIIKALEFPIDLKIDSKLLSSKNNYQPKEKQYKLFAVVYHDGKEATKGHYLTDAYHVGYASWLRYDDSMVTSVQEEQVLKPTETRVPYLLFYRRCDTVRK